jgi:hypothetical protein
MPDKKENIEKPPKHALASGEEQIREYSPDFVKRYANHANVSISLWDVALTFGEIEGERDGKAVISQTVRVNMSKELAKVLLALLGQHLFAYESEIGEIVLPDLKAINEKTEKEKSSKPEKKSIVDGNKRTISLK